jgi:23S rRNA pseudouridine2605 synthase
MRERVQKLLASQGYGSRREIERWIRAGRLVINGSPAVLGTLVDPTDRISLDGRPLHLNRPAAGPEVCIMYHRATGESLDPDADPPARLFASLPKRAGRRWIFVSPMNPPDSGLELLTTDGDLASALMRRASTLGARFAVRVRGEISPEQLAQISAGHLDDGTELGAVSVAAAGGEGSNRWYEIALASPRATSVRRLCSLAGLEVSRSMRILYGPLALDPELPRGRHRELTPSEVASLRAAAGLEAAAPAPAPLASKARRKSSRDAGRAIAGLRKAGQRKTSSKKVR